MSLALVYDGSIRDTGTPFYFRVAFSKLLGRSVDWYSEAGDIPKGHDFYVHIDDGRDDLPQCPPHPWGYYATDTHLGFEPRLKKALQADITWCAQKPGAEAFRARGANAYWLPLACEPMNHPTAHELGKKYDPMHDVVFVGHMQDPARSNRIDFLQGIFDAIPNFWVGFSLFHEAMAMGYHRGKIGINHAVRDDLNMRFFELASIGVPQLCDRRMVGLGDLGFEEFVHYIPYSSVDEAITNALDYLRPESQGDLAVMAAAAHAHVRRAHTYEHRAQAICAAIEKEFPNVDF